MDSHYPHHDVLAEQDAWDEYTRSIVLQRLAPKASLAFLTPEEAQTLRACLAHLFYESRDAVLEYLVAAFDARLARGGMESERAPSVPPAPELIRTGLAALNAATQAQQGQSFADSDVQAQFQLLATLQHGRAALPPAFQSLPQKPFFKLLHVWGANFFASHPHVWSEIGYAGPAYPRGYYRIELGLRDPWEALRENSTAGRDHADERERA